MVTGLTTKSTNVGEGLWQWSACLGPHEPLEAVQEVIYTLHSSFSRPVRRVREREDGFLVQDTTSCPFTIYAKIVFLDGREQLVHKDLELEKGEPQNESRARAPRKPLIITVDDDAEVVRSLERDLKKRYAAAYEVKRFENGATALELLETAKQKSVKVALIIADVRMPVLNGVDFLIAAARIQPRALRSLLTAYADSTEAIRALNAGIDRYLMKPWDPPELKLYPVTDGLLNEWSRQEVLF